MRIPQWKVSVLVACALQLFCCFGSAETANAQPKNTRRTYRFAEGITAYVSNPEGKKFTVDLDVRDLNLFANGPREVLFKIYDPDGIPVVREFIADDGVTTPNFPGRIGGWDHELQYYANLREKGTEPSFRWSAWSDEARLNSIVKRTFSRPINGGKKGVYRIVLAGTSDHYVTLTLSPNMSYGVAGHPTFMHGHGEMFQKSYLYVPQDTTGIFFAAAEPDEPRTRRFKLTAPDGKVLFDEAATGSFRQKTLADAAAYAGKVLTLEIAPGSGDYLVKLSFTQSMTRPASDRIGNPGMGSMAVFAPDEATAKALQGGTLAVDNQLF